MTNKDFWRKLDQLAPTCCVLKVREVLNNMFNKKAIVGLGFNAGDAKNAVAVPKILLEMIMPGPKPKPENFVDAK